jgi:hypothetical protein
VDVARRLERWGTERSWHGSDPYEGLRATRFVGPLRRSALGRRLITHAVKRSPINLRPLLGIAPGRNAASVSWVVSTYARNRFLPTAEAEHRLREALGLLREMRAPGFEEPCWGYHFDYQSRVLFRARDEPNTIASAYAGLALLDAYEATRDRSLLEEAAGVGRFFLRCVPQTPAGEGAYFGYAVDERTPIHNANMHVCALLARLCAHGADDHGRFRDAAAAALRYTLARQRADGSWAYGERSDLDWVDGFHTGYVLDALRVCADAGLHTEAAGSAWSRGLAFYRDQLIQANGAPKYYSNAVYPLDTQCAAQAIQTFSIAARHDSSCAADAHRVYAFAISHMRRRDGLFVFQRRRLWANRAPHVRWVVAPMLLALTYLIELDQASEDARPRAVAA